jgi:hypothetical protein
VSEVIGKTALVSFLFFLVVHISGADPLSRAETAMHFAEEVQRSLPFTTLTTLAWSDTYIGQLISRKPHFGAGISYGMAMSDFSSMRNLLDDFGTTAYMDTGSVMVPQMYGHIRLGGFFVPFDIGLVASIPLNIRPADGFLLEQQTIGGDIRFALSRDEEKLPGISLGIAYAQTTGRLSTEVSGSDVAIQWSGNAIEIKVQISKTLRIFTPYLGGGGSFTWSRAGYEATGEEWGTGDEDFSNGVLFRVFGGTSVKRWVLRLDFNINVSVPNLEYGVVLGLRFQL